MRLSLLLKTPFLLFPRDYSNERGMKTTHERRDVSNVPGNDPSGRACFPPQEFETKSRQSFSKPLSQKDRECSLARNYHRRRWHLCSLKPRKRISSLLNHSLPMHSILT